MKKLLMLGLIMGISTATLTGCSGGGNSSNKKIVTLLVPGNLGDLSYFDSMNDAIKKVGEEYKDEIEVKVREIGSDSTKFAAALNDVAKSSDMVISAQWDMPEPMMEAAEDNQKTKFVLWDSNLGSGYENTTAKNNMVSFETEISGAAYMSGVVAGLMTESNKIGFIGGMDIPVINDFGVPFLQGALSVNENVRIATGYVDHWADSTKGKQMALAQYNSGADVVMTAAGQSGSSLFEAADEATTSSSFKWAVGVDADQYKLNAGKATQEHIITSMLGNIEAVARKTISSFLEGTLTYGKANMLTFADDSSYIIENDFFNSKLGAEKLAQFNTIKANLKDGKIEVKDALKMTTSEVTNYFSQYSFNS